MKQRRTFLAAVTLISGLSLSIIGRPAAASEEPRPRR